MRGFIVVCVALLIGGAAVAMSELTEEKTYSWRYRMTVNVETPEGLKSGSGVREVEVTFKPRPGYSPNPYHASHRMRGEAVPVDLGERGVLFALITFDSYPEVTSTFEGPPAFTLEGAEFYSALKNAKATLDPLRYPSYPGLVTFVDPDDPKSVQSVMTFKRTGRLKDGTFAVAEDRTEELFGEGVRIESITVEMTDDPVDWGRVDAFFPDNFWESFGEWWKSLDMRERSRLAHNFSFKTGEQK
ncbi:MAG: hypothetical protein Rhims3KO_36170 [Hyphomicrobiales bacterium]